MTTRTNTKLIKMETGIDSDIQQLHDSCGIITAWLTDPLSLLLNKILALNDDNPNAVGFYYESDIQGVHATNVLLFNVYDNHVVPWLKLGCTMSKLLTSAYVRRITYYPLARVTATTSSSLLSRMTLGHLGAIKILDKFKLLVIEFMSNNARMLHDKSQVYTLLLQRAVGLSKQQLTTGYNLVNSVLAMLTGDKAQCADALIPCTLLKKSISIVSNTILSQVDEHTVQETRHELTMLLAIFLDLLTTSIPFSRAIHEKVVDNNTIDLSLLDSLMNCEEQLATLIVSSVQAGLLSNATLNNHIKELVKQRIILGNYRPLTMSIHPALAVEITQQEVMCSFQQPPLNNVNSLRDLGAYLDHLVVAFNSSQPLIINLGGIISAYNLTVQNTTLPGVILPVSTNKHTLSRTATVTIPGDPTVAQLTIANHDIVIPIYDANLTILTESQLIAILVYIDSLRAPDGYSDTRFAQLQNEVVQELARRRVTI